MKYLIVNPGSSSRKYAMYEGGQEIFAAHFEKENGGYAATLRVKNLSIKKRLNAAEYKKGAALFFEYARLRGIIHNHSEIKAAGVRIVAPGAYFIKTRFIDKKFRKKLKEAEASAPLHIAPVLGEIDVLAKFLPTLPLIGVSDSSFHATIPAAARFYALPLSDSRRYGIYRFGYHGISVQSLLRKIKRETGHLPPRVIVCHLGGGASITAVKNAKSFDTSMGFTPLEGLVMGTRPGDLDSGALIYLMKKLKFSPGKMDSYLNQKCGLLGLSHKTDDVRGLIALTQKGDKRASLALKIFVYKIKKYIGAYLAALGGLDLLIFTAAIGEHSHIMREKICEGLEEVGIKLDQNKNKHALKQDGFIHYRGAKIKIMVVKTEEAREMSREVERFLEVER